jgi:hypothetical protein
MWSFTALVSAASVSSCAVDDSFLLPLLFHVRSRRAFFGQALLDLDLRQRLVRRFLADREQIIGHFCPRNRVNVLG